MKLPAVPLVKVVLLALAITGAAWTVNVKTWLPAGSMVSVALMVNEYVPAGVAVVLVKVAVPSWLSVNVTPVGSESLVPIETAG